MNPRGNSKNLVASHPGNLNAAKEGVHSKRLIDARAAEIQSELEGAYKFSPVERLAVLETARCIAILEAIDRDLDKQGLVDSKGNPRYLLNTRARVSRQLEQWLAKVSAVIEKQTKLDEPPAEPPKAELADYVRALQRIALAQDPSAKVRDQLSAIRELMKLGPRATTSFLERPAQQSGELLEQEHALAEAEHLRELARRRRLVDLSNS